MYFKPYIDATGYHYPTYNDILEHLIDRMQTIYGSGIYLGNDSKDYEMLSTFAEITYDTYQSGEILYNAQSSETAIGTGLDYQAACAGIARKQATKSTVTLTLTGTAGTVITSGVCADDNGYIWDIDGAVTIGSGGTATVTAYCREYGFISAAANTITRIMTPVLGWVSVTNTAAAEAGMVAEKDSELRARYRSSTSLLSESILDGMRSAILTVKDVNRCVIYENTSNTTNADGIPAHCICCVVEGGQDQAIADMIWLKKGVGCGTYGGEAGDPNLVECTVTDGGGIEHTVAFSRISQVDVNIAITIYNRGGYSAAVGNEIKLAIINHLDTFGIGIDLDVSSIWSVAQNVNADLSAPGFSVRAVTAARGTDALSTNDVVIGMNEVAHATAETITITVANAT